MENRWDSKHEGEKSGGCERGRVRVWIGESGGKKLVTAYQFRAREVMGGLEGGCLGRRGRGRGRKSDRAEMVIYLYIYIYF